MWDHNRAASWIDFARSCDYTADRIAECCEVSVAQLGDWFCIVAQKPFDYWLCETRAWDAARFLALGYSCDETAVALGFADDQHFSKHFQSYFGIPPKDFPKDHDSWARSRMRYLKQIFEPDPVPEELLEPIWAPAFRVLIGRLPLGGTQEEFVPSRRLLVDSLHARLCAGNEAAADLICDLLRRPTVQKLSRRFQDVDIELIEDGFVDAIMQYLSDPAMFNPPRGSLEAFLYAVAWRKVWKLRRAFFRRMARDVPMPDDFPDELNLISDTGADVPGEDPPRSDFEKIKAALPELLQRFLKQLNWRDQQACALMLSQTDKKPDSGQFETILGISHLKAEERQKQVKRVKERLKRQFRSFVKRHNQSSGQ